MSEPARPGGVRGTDAPHSCAHHSARLGAPGARPHPLPKRRGPPPGGLRGPEGPSKHAVVVRVLAPGAVVYLPDAAGDAGVNRDREPVALGADSIQPPDPAD